MIETRFQKCVVCGGPVLALLEAERKEVWCSTHTADELREAAGRLDKDVGNESTIIALRRAANYQRQK